VRLVEILNAILAWFRRPTPVTARPEAAGPGSAEGMAAAPAPPHAFVTAELLRRLGVAAAEEWAAVLHPACRQRGITTPLRLAHFLGTILHESVQLSHLVESLNYTPEALLRTWPARFTAAQAARCGRRQGQLADQEEIAEIAYGGRMGNGPAGSGDGWRYRGRGVIQITGRTNYLNTAAALGVPFAQLPAWLETRHGAAEAAAWWWAARGCNTLADAGLDEAAIEAVRRRVNGGVNGLDDVTARTLHAARLLGA
jgi:putative chitinase